MTDDILSPDLSDDDYDPEAPYGRKPDGTPYKMSPEARAATGTRLTAARMAARAAAGLGPAVGAPGKKTPARKTAGVVDYRPGIKGLLQLPAFGLAVVSRFQKVPDGEIPALALDGMTITLHSDTMAEALNSVAQEQPQVADALDRILAVGPYGAVLGAFLPVGLQIAANHGKMPVNAEMGILGPEQLLRELERQSGSGVKA